MRWFGRYISFLVYLSIILASGGTGSVATAQDLPDNWTKLYEEQGVEFSFIFYREGDTRNNGVVVRIDNTSERAMRYRFTMVFRGDSTEVVASPSVGTLEPGEMVTGSSEGLWWIPFTDGREIREVGIRGIDLTPLYTGDDRSF